MASKLDLIVRKHVLPVLDKEGIDVGLREVSAIARESGYKVSGNRLYRQPSDSEKPVRESHSKLADYIKWYIKTKTASEADDIGEKPGETAAVAAAEPSPSADPADPLAPRTGEIRTRTGLESKSIGSVEPVPLYTGTKVPVVPLYTGTEAPVASQEPSQAPAVLEEARSPEEQLAMLVDKRRHYLDQFVLEAGEGRVLDAAGRLHSYFNEVLDQYNVPLTGDVDGEKTFKFAEDFARLACGRGGKIMARHYGEAIENLLVRDTSGRLAGEAARSLPELYTRLTVKSVDKFLTEAVQKIDEYNALPKKKRTKAAWEGVVNYFAVSSTQAMMDRDSLLVEEHPQLLEDLAGVRDNLKQALKDSSQITADRINEQLRAKRAEGEIAALKGDLDIVKSMAVGYKNSSRAFKYLSVVALTVGFVVGGALGRTLGRKSSSYEDRQESDRHAHQAEVLKNEKKLLEDDLNQKSEAYKNLSIGFQRQSEVLKQMSESGEGAYSHQLQTAFASLSPNRSSQVESIVERYINERGQGRVVVHASTCQSAMRYLHHLMGGAAEQEDAFVDALRGSSLCQSDIKKANLYIFKPTGE